MTAIYFVAVYGWFAGMIVYAVIKEPKRSGNTGMRL